MSHASRADSPSRKRVLIVSPAFPPMSTPDLQRVRMSLPYYGDFGWDPVVLTVHPKHQEGAREEELAATVPDTVPVHYTGAVSPRLGRWLGLGNLGLRAWLPLFLAGLRLLRREKFDLVFFSTTQFITFPLGRLWRMLCRVPYVIDLQDPWRTDYYERPGVRRPPGGWKYQFARLQARLLEEWSFRRVGAFMSVSAEYLVELRRRYPWFSAVPSQAIGFGASEADLAIARALPLPRVSSGGPGVIRLVYTGAAGPVTPHAASLLFEALQQARSVHPTVASRLRFEFLGTSYAPEGRAVPALLPLAEQFGVADQVREISHRLGHLACVRIQAEADVLLLLGSSDLAYSPSKIYPYFLAERPILSLVFRNSLLETILRELNCSTMVVFDESALKADALAALVRYFAGLASGKPLPIGPRNTELFQREFLARSLTEKQVRLFEQALPAIASHGSV